MPRLAGQTRPGAAAAARAHPHVRVLRLVARASATAAAASKSQINLKWADRSGDETGFKVERSTDGVTFTQLATLAANSTSYASTGLSGGKKYHYRVRAYNANGNSSYTSVVTATTPTK